MRQEKSPWNKSYQYLKMQRHREQKRSEKQNECTKSWGAGFNITSESKTDQTHLDAAKEFCDSRRNVDDLAEVQRLASELKEVWE